MWLHAPLQVTGCQETTDFHAHMARVTAACCGDASLCTNGLPTVCDVACAALMLPMATACGSVIAALGLADEIT